MTMRQTRHGTHHIPEAPRHLPADLYGRFDIQPTPDGGKRYSLPTTLGASVMAFVTKPRAVLAVAGMALVWPVLFPEHDTGSPLTITWLYALLIFLLLHGLLALGVTAVLLATRIRKVTRITIRPDGLILDDVSFFPADHIWSIGYGVTSNEGKPDETFAPHITIQVGTNRITLAEGVEVEAGRLFMRLFEEDTRHYWARHN
jgi:hypothetical protein